MKEGMSKGRVKSQSKSKKMAELPGAVLENQAK
jgi:hypothetical protein